MSEDTNPRPDLSTTTELQQENIFVGHLQPRGLWGHSTVPPGGGGTTHGGAGGVKGMAEKQHRHGGGMGAGKSKTGGPCPDEHMEAGVLGVNTGVVGARWTVR